MSKERLVRALKEEAGAGKKIKGMNMIYTAEEGTSITTF